MEEKPPLDELPPDRSPLRKHLEILVTNPALLTVYATACAFLIAITYNFGFWWPFRVNRGIFPIQFWSISDLVSSSLWAVAPALALPTFMLLIMAAMRWLYGPRKLRHYGNASIVALTAFGILIVFSCGDLLWTVFVPLIGVLIAWLSAKLVAIMIRKDPGVESDYEYWDVQIAFIFIATLLFAAYFGHIRASRIIEGRSYVEIGPPEQIHDAISFPSPVTEPFKLLARNSSGYLVLASDVNAVPFVVFIPSDKMKSAWFYQTGSSISAELKIVSPSSRPRLSP
jgi:hypothetical protein